MHTLIPALALRDGQPVARVRRDGRAHASADAPPGAHAPLPRRRRPAGRDHRAAVGGRSRPLARADRRPRSTTTLVDGLRARGHDVRRQPRATTTAWATRTRSRCLEPRLPGRHRPTRRRRGRGPVAAGLRERRTQLPCMAVSTTRIWTIPNLISVVRLACVPVFLWLLWGEDEPIAAAVLLAVLGATDWVDGYIARHFDQGSELGKILDPIADRVLLVAAAVALLVDGPPGRGRRRDLARARPRGGRSPSRRSRSRSPARAASTCCGRARRARSR